MVRAAERGQLCLASALGAHPRARAPRQASWPPTRPGVKADGDSVSSEDIRVLFDTVLGLLTVTLH